VPLDLKNIQVVASEESEEVTKIDKPLPRIKHAHLVFALTLSVIAVEGEDQWIWYYEILDKGKRSRMIPLPKEIVRDMIEEVLVCVEGART